LASAAGATIVLVFMVRRSEASTIELGDVYLLGTVISGAFGYALSGRLSRTLPGWEVISWQVAAFLPLSLLTSTLLAPNTFAGVTAPAWAGLVYVSFISQFFAFFVFNAAMAMGGVARVGQMMLLQPFLIVALSVPVNGERFDASTLLYAAAVVVTVVVGQRMQVTRR
jgi:drug/metabolite transporter (DMT)-like permease